MEIRPSDEAFLATGTVIHAAQSGTAVDVISDVQKLKAEVVGLENELISRLESGDSRLRLEDVADVDARLEAARYSLADLEATQQFIISKQRERAAQDNHGLTYMVYLVKWASTSSSTATGDSAATTTGSSTTDSLLHVGEKPPPPLGFSGSQVGEYVRELTTMHLTTGATGVLYVLRGWFAGYVEADAETVFKMARNLKFAKESTDRFDRIIIVERERILPPIRRYPNDALKVVHLETQQSVAQAAPEASILREISHVMNLDVFVPELSVANRGSGARVGDSLYMESLELNKALEASAVMGRLPLQINTGNVALTEDGKMSVVGASTKRVEGSLPRRSIDASAMMTGALEAPPSYLPLMEFPTVQRLLVSVSPQLTFYESGLPIQETARIIDKVCYLANKHVAQFATSQYRCATAGPHTMDTGLILVIDTSNAAHAVQLVVDLFKDYLSKDGEIRTFYKPVIAIHSSTEVGTIMNGITAIVGPALRYLRKQVALCRQEGYPVLISYTAADRAERQRCKTVGSFMIDRDPSELFIPLDLERVRYEPESELFRKLRSEAELVFNAHIEGPGPIEPESATQRATAQHLHHDAQRKQYSATRSAAWGTTAPTGTDPPGDAGEDTPFFAVRGMMSLKEIRETYDELLERAEREHQSALEARRMAKAAMGPKKAVVNSALDKDEEEEEEDSTLGGVPWDLFETYYHTFDTLGVPPSSAVEIRNLIEATTEGMLIHPTTRLAMHEERRKMRASNLQSMDLISFEQFCAAMYHILKQ